jgi:hypothetical protein
VVLNKLIHRLPQRDVSILVSGLDFPFSPFDHWRSILLMNPPAGVKFFIVTYSKNEGVPQLANWMRQMGRSQRLRQVRWRRCDLTKRGYFVLTVV